MTMLPPGFSTRPTEAHDLPALLELIDLQQRKDYAEPTNTRLSDLQARWDRGGSAAFSLIVDASDQPAAYAQLIIASDRNDLSLGTILWVAPELRGQGLEAAIIEQAEQQALKLAPRTGRIEAWAFAQNQPAATALEQLGYAGGIAFQTMTITLKEPPAASAAIPGLELRPFGAGRDEQAAYNADEEASLDKGYGHPKSYPEWATRLRLRPDVAPWPWFLAWDGAEVAGGIFCEKLADSPQGLIHHLGVRRPWRGKGLGQALLEQAFRAFYAAGIFTLTLDVETGSPTGAQRLYSRCGMQVTGTRMHYAKVLRPASADSAAAE